MTEVVGEANDENEHPLPSISQGSKQCLVFTVVSHVIQLFLFHIHISNPLKKKKKKKLIILIVHWNLMFMFGCVGYMKISPISPVTGVDP